MSDDQYAFLKGIEADKEEIARKNDLAAKKLAVEQRRYTQQYNAMVQTDSEMAKAKALSFGQADADYINELTTDSDEYIEAAKNSMMFINETFSGVVPYFQKNLILLGGKTGDGKSTAVANIAFNTIRKTNPLTGKTRRVLILTNEEKPEDCYNRITCLIKGWHYVNHNQFTDDQKKTFSEYIPKLASGGRLTIIGDTYKGVSGMTTTIEGICTIFDNLLRDKEYYDAVIIDYYQNVKFSKMLPHLDEYQVQAMLSAKLDTYKNIYPAPIILMAQVNPPDEDKKTPFEHRIKGRKVIVVPATVIMEMIADRPGKRTEWLFHKSRFTSAIGGSYFTGYEKGAFVPYDDDFKRKVARFNEEEMNKAVFKNVYKQGEDKNGEVPKDTSGN